jgi:protein-L-isoaspartate(D-aspartate) O-methyltransferase
MRRLVGAVLIILTGCALTREAAPDYAAERRDMIASIQETAQLAGRRIGIASFDERVLRAMATVPRHEFVPEPLRPLAYAEMPLPLGFGQNLSMPFITALVTDLLRIKPGDVVLETGTDTGYQAAVFAEMGAKVYSIEAIEPLYKAAERLLEQHRGHVFLRLGDGFFGWPEAGPFDAILVKESMDELPAPLLNQLRRGGRMVLPLGPASGAQQLTLIEKTTDGRIRQRSIMPVRFTPMQGGERI